MTVARHQLIKAAAHDIEFLIAMREAGGPVDWSLINAALDSSETHFRVMACEATAAAYLSYLVGKYGPKGWMYGPFLSAQRHQDRSSM